MGNKKEKICGFCGRKITFWQGQLLKHEGKEICRDCRIKIAREKYQNQKNASKTKKAQSIFKKMIFFGFGGLSIILGIFTLPIGILFIVLGIILLAKIFKS